MDKNLTEREIELLVHKVNIISTNKILENEFRKTYATDWDLIKATIESNLIKASAIALINKIVPTVFKIGDKLFMLGEIKKHKCDFIGDDLDEGDIIEIYDVSTEMRTGESYTFYVSTTDYFPVASMTDTMTVLEFMNRL